MPNYIDRVRFNGHWFRLYKGQRYYVPGVQDRQNGVDWLHREIYKHHHGKIPRGHSVHHRDHDHLNNSPSNLVLMRDGEHQSEHGRHRWMHDRKKTQAIMALGIEAAKKWHRSKAGRAWHRIHGQECWKNKKRMRLRCVMCNASFWSFMKWAKYCSWKCRWKSARVKRK